MSEDYRLPRLEISQKLAALAAKKIKEHKIRISRASKKILAQIGSVSEEILKNGIPTHLVLKKLKGNLGRGIFLHPEAAPIVRGSVIAPYSGEVFICPQNDGNDSDYVFSLMQGLLLTKEEQHIWDPSRKYHPRRFYSLDLDAEKKGNFTRFINHSTEPNVEADFLRTPENPFEVVYIAKKTIKPGEQLLVCYEGEDKSYWGALKMKPFPMTPKTFQLNTSLKVIGG